MNSGAQGRSINIPAANYLLFGAGLVTEDESWLVPGNPIAAALTGGAVSGARVHAPRDGLIKRVTVSQSTPTVQPVAYTLEYFDTTAGVWTETAVAGAVAVGEQKALIRGATVVIQGLEFIRVRINKAPAEPDVTDVRAFVELA